jgi:uncharacterized protein
MSKILMKKGTAVWLARNTKLSDFQIASFCGLHELEVEMLRSSDNKTVASNPVSSFLLTDEEISRCEKDSSLALVEAELPIIGKKARKTKSSAKKNELFNAILWFIENHSSLSDSAIAKFLGCGKTYIEQIKDKQLKDFDTIIPKHPVMLGLCSQDELDILLSKKTK